ncbi:unnamed protein product, partial [Anisakis simplex]|uniref:Probable N-acetylgalactosaminyltransferase 9 (inferred by orthology to a C. elegans protein) n=1 Tax=Anisakis simplex TaxID=6269 RepID=A0A158PNU1_ANISI
MVRESAKKCLRYISPRRKENVLNMILLIVLSVMVIYYFQVRFKRYEMPKYEGVTWPESSFQMQHVIPDYSKHRSGPGENGNAVSLSGEEKERGDADMKKWFMNVVASDKVSLDRSLPDTRHPKCRLVKYDIDDLPRTSVIIIFTDEAWTPLLRTVHSVINRTPPRLLEEVILLDDFSQRDELKGKLNDYIKRFGGLVKLIRKNERQGLIRAKLEGAKLAVGEVIVFLDSHCEANAGWLEPILARIKTKRSAVVCPIIDYIEAETMRYSGGGHGDAVGGFWWSLHFRWDPIGEAEQKRRKSVTEYV